MDIVKFQEFNQQLKKRYVMSSIYLFIGTDSYLINCGINKLTKVMHISNVNKEIFYIQQTSIKDILNSLHTYPLFNETREIIIKDIDKMSKTDTHFLMNYLSNIIPTSYLILIYPNNYNNDSLMIRQEFIKKCIASNNCTVVDCNSLDYKELKHFIKSEFDLRNKVATNEILSIFSTWLGNDLSHIINEIEKITLLIDDSHNNNVITKNDCSLIVKKNYYKQIHSLYLSIVNKSITLALRTLWQLLDNYSQDPLIILYVIHSTILKILNAKYMLEKKDLSNTEIAKTIKIKQEDLETFFTQLHKHKFETLQTSFKLLLEADIQLKTTHNTQQEIQFIFEDLLILICQV